MIDYHRISADQFASLATSLGGSAAVTRLAAAQSSKRRLLLRYAMHARPDADLRSAIDVLISADQRDRRTVANLIGDPLVGTWVAWTVRRLLGRVDSGIPIDDDLAQVGALAAAAALRTGLEASIPTRAREGRVTLPGFGTAMIGSSGPVVISVAGGLATVSGNAGTVRVTTDDPRWQPLRHLSARFGAHIGTVAVEDCSPYRDSYHAPPAARLPPDDFREWQEMFDHAWALLGRNLPARTAELAAGLRTVVPLAADTDDAARSGTTRDSFGALGLTRPQSEVEFAVTIVHEFQHSKLSGLLDLVPLIMAGGKERHFAPWRSDPRPTGGLIHGVYAFLGVADTWRALRAEPGLERQATHEFAIVRQQVDAGLTSLENSAELTVAGRAFVAGLRATSNVLMAEPVPSPVAAEAAVELAECRRAWDDRHRGS